MTKLMKRSSIKKGFTLVELLMVMGIMGFLMVILFQVIGSILDLKVRSEAITAVAQDSRYLITRLTYDISRASTITSPVPGASGSSLQLLIGGDTYLYQLSGNTLNLSLNGGTPYALNGIGSRITSINFTRYADVEDIESVGINLVITPTTVQSGGVDATRILNTTVATR